MICSPDADDDVEGHAKLLARQSPVLVVVRYGVDRRQSARVHARLAEHTHALVVRQKAGNENVVIIKITKVNVLVVNRVVFNLSLSAS